MVEVHYPANITPKQRRVLDAMRAGIESGEWQAHKNDGIRFSRERPTNEINRRRYPDMETYTQLVFVTLTTGPRGRVLIGVSRACMGGRDDQWVTLDRALAILADPAAFLDNPLYPKDPPPRY